MAGIELKDPSFFLSDLLYSVPFIIKDGKEFKFVHKTIPEYFATEYLNYPEDSLNLFKKNKRQ